MDAPRTPRARHDNPTRIIGDPSIPQTRQLAAAVCLLHTLFVTVSICASDFYLARLGPAPLRFAPAPTNANFKWPMPLATPTITTNVPCTDKFSTAFGPTNVLTTIDPALAHTNSTARPQADEISASSLANIMPMPVGVDGNPLSASNLLVVTPQMLADYLKATLDGSSKSSTNAPAGADIPFNPPTPKLPASEATYGTQ